MQLLLKNTKQIQHNVINETIIYIIIVYSNVNFYEALQFFYCETNAKISN